MKGKALRKHSLHEKTAAQLHAENIDEININFLFADIILIV